MDIIINEVDLLAIIKAKLESQGHSVKDISTFLVPKNNFNPFIQVLPQDPNKPSIAVKCVVDI